MISFFRPGKSWKMMLIAQNNLLRQIFIAKVKHNQTEMMIFFFGQFLGIVYQKFETDIE